MSGVQFPLSGPLPCGHQGPQARGDDHLRSVRTYFFIDNSIDSLIIVNCRNPPGDWSPSSHTACLPRLLQACYQQICVSTEINIDSSFFTNLTLYSHVRCPKCGWPMCNEKCARSPVHEAECNLTQIRSEKLKK